jgi:hypothetical protein
MRTDNEISYCNILADRLIPPHYISVSFSEPCVRRPFNLHSFLNNSDQATLRAKRLSRIIHVLKGVHCSRCIFSSA